jgi:hypothetical protein
MGKFVPSKGNSSMETPPSELLELLREVRDNQRELLALTKAWKERSDRQYQEWEEDSPKVKAAQARWELSNEHFLEVNRLWLKQYRGLPPFGRIVFALVKDFVLVVGAVLGTIAALHWLK